MSKINNINMLLHKAVSLNASDIHIKVGSPPIVRVNGQLFPLLDEPKMKKEDTLKIASSVLNEKQQAILNKKREIDTAYSILGLSRFRCNIFFQRGTISAVFRVIPFGVKS
ncbi:MAG: type IV pili twitching motility protein PilT, partial [Nitrospirae bacterium]